MGFDGNEGRKGPWKVTDAPGPYLEVMKKAILGVEIDVTRLAGKWKMSQELANGDRKGVIEGFEQMKTDVGMEMARVVKEREALKEAGR